MNRPVPVIDLFAGPGGLGEGFAAYRYRDDPSRRFKIALSVEKDEHAHRTLELRSFYRQFPDDEVPEEYYRYLAGDIRCDDLFAAHPKEARHAHDEVLRATLGVRGDNRKIYSRIQSALGNQRRRWVLIGGPPCQAYSTIGRARMRGANPTQFESDPRHLLYREYLKVLARFGPAVFVMENVKGMLSSRLNGEPIVERIFADLKDPRRSLPEPNNGWEGQAPRYEIYSLVARPAPGKRLDPADYLIKAEKFGVPQTRHRVILLGVRRDVTGVPGILEPHDRTVSIEDVLDGLPPLRSQLSRRSDQERDSPKAWHRAILSLLDQPWFSGMKVPLPLDALSLFDNLDVKVPPVDLSTAVRERMEQALNSIRWDAGIGGEFVPGQYGSRYCPDWYGDPRLPGVCNHTSRMHMVADLYRYLFVACYAQVGGISPKLRDFPEVLLPRHESATRIAGVEEDFDDRFRVQVKGQPSTTIMSHIAKDGHYTIHYDPGQCRSLTVREAARLQTFPDNYFFEGPRTEQYKQVGNAVPPLLARQIAGIVACFLNEQ